MKKMNYKILVALLVSAFICSVEVIGQDSPPKAPPLPTQAPAGFDVIIKKNGDFIYGLVKEVGQEFIKYQRTDIPDGPIYMVAKNEVYAISYRNQLKEIINPMSQFPVSEAQKQPIEIIKRDTIYVLPAPPPPPPPMPEPEKEKKKMPMTYKNGNILFALGFIQGYSKVENKNDYSASTTFPNLSLAYEVKKSDNLRLGLQAAIGSRKFTRQEYSAYDSATNDIILRESNFTLHLYGKHFIKAISGSFHPYVMGGIGIHSSYIKSEYTLQFINNANQSILVKSGARAVGINALLRVGGNYDINEQLQAFADVGFGPAIIQLGLVFKMDQFKKKI